MKGETMLRQLGVVALVATALAVVPAALGDSGSPNYSSKLTSVAPGVKGLTVRVVDGDDALELRNASGLNVMVPGYENEPYLRFLVNGRVEVNVNSPAKYLNEERYAGVTVPKEASAGAKPKWVLLAQDGSYTWHEHRVHWMSTAQPPRVKASGGAEFQKVFDWIVPLSVGGKRVKASGTLWWVPTGQLERADALIAAAVKKEARAKEAAAPASTGKGTTTAAAEEASPPVAAAAQTASDSSSPVLWIVIAVLAVALVGAGVYVLRLRRHNSPGPSAEDPGPEPGEAW